MAGRSLLFGRKLHLPAGPVRLQWDPSRCCRTGDMASPLRTLPVFSACKIAPRAVCCYGRQKTEQPKRETRKAGNAQSGEQTKQEKRIKQETDKTENRKER